jgi:hypothetical protein
MKKIMLIALTGLLMAGSAVPALALGPLDINADLPLYSKYVWRGINLTNDYVLQPELDISLMGFKLGVWGNYELTDVNEMSGDFSEFNYSLAWGMSFPFINLGIGYIYYEYPEAGEFNTSEFYVSGKVNVLLSPSLTIYQDVDKFKGAYWEASVSYDFELGETTKLETTGGLGLGSKSYITGYFPVDPDLPWSPDFSTDASATDYYLDLRVPFHPIPFITVAPSLTWTSLLGEAKDSVSAAPDDTVYSGITSNFYWGITASFGF